MITQLASSDFVYYFVVVVVFVTVVVAVDLSASGREFIQAHELVFPGSYLMNSLVCLKGFISKFVIIMDTFSRPIINSPSRAAMSHTTKRGYMRHIPCMI